MADSLGVINVLDPLDYDRLRLKQAAKGPSSGSAIRFVFVLYNKSKLQLRLPRLTTPFGVTTYMGNMYLELSLKDNEAILHKMHEIDAELIHALVSLLGNQFTTEDIQNGWMSSVRLPLNPVFSPTLKIKLTKDKEDDYTFSLYSSRKAPDGKGLFQFDPTCDEEVKDTLPKRSELSSIIELSCIWYDPSEPKFGTTWRLVQAKKYEKDNTAPAAKAPSSMSKAVYAFDDNNPDSDED